MALRKRIGVMVPRDVTGYLHSLGHAA